MSRSSHRLGRRPFIAMLATAAAPLLPARLALAGPNEQAFVPYWIQNHSETDLWSGSDARSRSFGKVPPFSYFRVLAPQQGARLYVQNPLDQGTAWIQASLVGPSGEPPESYFFKPAAPTVGKLNLPSRIVGGANVRRTPIVAVDNLVARTGHNDSVTVLDEVTGGDGEPWYRIAEDQYVHSSLVRLPRPFPPHPGKLILADLKEPVIVTAYEDAKPIYSGLALKGTIGWGTPTGFFTIQRRVQNETMNSETLGIPRSAPGGYFLQNVLYTQYFTGDGAAIHYNWWSGNFGYSGSHGCLGMNLEDSRWLWEWASTGTPLIIHD